jgi:transglutaminase-like putative cysteine protease
MISERTESVSRPLLASLILLLSAAASPHFLHLNIWITLFFIGALALRIASILRPALAPGRLLLVLLAMLSLANVIFHYPVLFSGETSVALMTSMVSLKLLEIRNRRDLYVVVFVGYFLLITQFLFEQGMLMVAFVFLLALGLTSVLVEINRAKSSVTPLRPLKAALSLLLQAAPLMLVLFVFFPRLSGPIWSLSSPQTKGTTGVGDHISMGTFSELVLSDAVAFRADFEGDIPPPDQRYWRGPVLWQSYGRHWIPGKAPRFVKPKFGTLDQPLFYSVTLEPTDKYWMFALDLPSVLPPDSGVTADFQLIRKKPISQRILYRVGSNLRYNTGLISDEERQRGLQLPANITPRMRALVEEWRNSGNTSADVVNQALLHFREQEFYYTLYPPPLDRNPVDQFLFESRRGFCEHYATSFATLMRIAGIPTRVVIGYQGGEVNPMGDYLIVRQSDAHAWTEVWLEGNGWVRIDPTAAVAPERIERSFEFDLAGESTAIGTPINFDIQSSFIQRLARQIRWGVDAINASWHRWVLGYSRDRQLHLMNLLGLGFLKGHKLALGMIVFAGFAVLIIGFFIWRRGRIRPDPIQVDYLRFCEKLGRGGLRRAPQEGPRDFGVRAKNRWPKQRSNIDRIIRLYIELRYGGAAGERERQLFRRAVREFKL